MTSEQFAYWLQGFAELNAQAPSQEQWQSIRDHLALVFEKKTPVLSFSQEQRTEWDRLTKELTRPMLGQPMLDRVTC